ncbi:hypothetical protein [Sporomusa aerivorans]|uniref:hypothetical protein n=1 Tax=Sporomusa aerivorans TaxID=204936 RepID=UPI00352BB50F
MASNKRQHTDKPEKVFDTSGIEAALMQDNSTREQDTAETNSANNSTNTDLDHQANGVINLNGIPVSASTGTVRTALMQPPKQSNTIQIDEESRISTYR